MKPAGLLLLACTWAHGQEAHGQEAAPIRPALRFVGRILDEHYLPVANAGFVVGANDRLVTASALESPLARTGTDGRFDFAAPPPPPDSQVVHSLLVAAPGKVSIRWANLTWPTLVQGSPRPSAMELGDVVLPDGVTVKGKLRGAGGRPLAGARIRIADLVSLRTTQSRLQASYAFSDAEGVFVLPGIPEGALHVCVDADGHYHKTISPVGARQPLVLELAESGFAEGKVVGSDGSPVRAYVRMVYEVDHYEQTAETGADGGFRLTVRFPCRYRVHATPIGREGPGTQSEVLDGPRKGLQLRLTTPPPAPTLSVVAVAARSGARVERFRAGAVWEAGGSGLESMFDAIARDSDRNGTATLELPAERPAAGVVRVVAPGFAAAREAVELKDGEPNKAEVRLEPESVLEGRVIDERTRAPVPGARVLWQAVRGEDLPPGQEEPVVETGPQTGADGVFRIGCLAPGKYELTAGHAQRPEGKKVTVELGKGETRRGLDLELPAGVAFSGRIVGAKVGPGWLVRLDLESRAPPFAWADFSSTDMEDEVSQQGAVDVRADGSFRFEGKGPGHYSLRLLLPSHPRSGPMLDVLVERLRIRRTDLTRECDVAEDLPGRIGGKVRCTGAQPLPGRMIVTAESTEDGGRRFFGPGQNLVGRRASVREDGGFAIVVPPGSYRLRVVDIETGILLFHDKRNVEVAAGALAEKDLAFELAEIRARLEPEQGTRWIAARLLVEAATKADDGSDVPFMVMMGSQSASSPGIDLGERPSDVSFFVPPGDAKLSVRSGVDKISARSANDVVPVLGEAEVKVEAGAVKAVKLKVAPPPDVREPDPEGDKKDG